MKAADEDVNDVVAVRRFQAILAEHASDLGLGDRLIVGTNQHRGDSPLHIYGAGHREQNCQLIQTSAIAQMMPRERVGARGPARPILSCARFRLSQRVVRRRP